MVAQMYSSFLLTFQGYVTRFYKAQASDSLIKLAYTFNLAIPVIKRTNNLISDELYPGQIIKLELPKDSDVLKNP